MSRCLFGDSSSEMFVLLLYADDIILLTGDNSAEIPHFITQIRLGNGLLYVCTTPVYVYMDLN